MLITADVGHTVGEFNRPGTADILRETAEAPTYAAEADRAILHVTPEPTPEIVPQVRELLLIPEHAWPAKWDTGGFAPYADTLAALSRLAASAPVAAPTNVPCIVGPRRIADLKLHCGQYLNGVFASFELGARRPLPHGWHTIAAEHGTSVSKIVHVEDDIRGTLVTGYAAGTLVSTREVLPADLHKNLCVTSVPNLAGAATTIASMAESMSACPHFRRVRSWARNQLSRDATAVSPLRAPST